jgi:hypothetical protein
MIIEDQPVPHQRPAVVPSRETPTLSRLSLTYRQRLCPIVETPLESYSKKQNSVNISLSFAADN